MAPVIIARKDGSFEGLEEARQYVFSNPVHRGTIRRFIFRPLPGAQSVVQPASDEPEAKGGKR